MVGRPFKIIRFAGLLAKTHTHLADLLHATDQVLLHIHNFIPPKWCLRLAAETVQIFTVFSHSLSQILNKIVLHNKYLQKMSCE